MGVRPRKILLSFENCAACCASFFRFSSGSALPSRAIVVWPVLVRAGGRGIGVWDAPLPDLRASTDPAMIARGE